MKIGYLHRGFQIGALVMDYDLHPSSHPFRGGRQGIILKIGKLSPSQIDRCRHTQILVHWSGAPDPLANGEHWCESGWLEVINESR